MRSYHTTPIKHLSGVYVWHSEQKRVIGLVLRHKYGYYMAVPFDMGYAGGRIDHDEKEVPATIHYNRGEAITHLINIYEGGL